MPLFFLSRYTDRASLQMPYAPTNFSLWYVYTWMETFIYRNQKPQTSTHSQEAGGNFHKHARNTRFTAQCSAPWRLALLINHWVRHLLNDAFFLPSLCFCFPFLWEWGQEELSAENQGAQLQPAQGKHSGHTFRGSEARVPLTHNCKKPHSTFISVLRAQGRNCEAIPIWKNAKIPAEDYELKIDKFFLIQPDFSVGLLTLWQHFFPAALPHVNQRAARTQMCKLSVFWMCPWSPFQARECEQLAQVHVTYRTKPVRPTDLILLHMGLSIPQYPTATLEGLPTKLSSSQTGRWRPVEAPWALTFSHPWARHSANSRR